MENTHRKLIELKEYLDNNSLNGTHLSNLPCYFWEILGECIDETKEVESKVTPNELESIEYIKRIRELISLGDNINFTARLIHLERMILDDISKAQQSQPYTDRTHFAKENMQFLEILTLWCVKQDISFSGKETATIISAVSEYIRQLNQQPDKPSVDKKSAEDCIKENCNIEYTKYSGEEVVHSSLSAVCIALEEYANQFKK